MLLGLSSGLVDLGHDVFAYGYGGAGAARTGSAVVSVLNMSEELGIIARIFTGRPGRVMSLLRRSDNLTSWLSSNGDDLDVVLIHGAFGASSPRVARAASRGGIVRIACPHDPYSPALFGTRTVVKHAYWQLVEAPYLRSTDAIHLLAPSHERYLRALGIPVPTFVVPNGLDGQRIQLADEVPSGAMPDSRSEAVLRLLYFGRWDIYNKGLDLLLTAIAQVRSNSLRIRLAIAGRATPTELGNLRRLVASLDLHEDVSIVGFLPDTIEAIRAADAVVLPSRFDGFGQVVLESLALGTPVLASSKAGATEFLGEDDGVLVAEPTVRSLGEALRALYRASHHLQASARSARSRLLDEFNWSSLAGSWADQVGRIMSTRRP